jgi:hypothetical protein
MLRQLASQQSTAHCDISVQCSALPSLWLPHRLETAHSGHIWRPPRLHAARSHLSTNRWPKKRSMLPPSNSVQPYGRRRMAVLSQLPPLIRISSTCCSTVSRTMSGTIKRAPHCAHVTQVQPVPWTPLVVLGHSVPCSDKHSGRAVHTHSQALRHPCSYTQPTHATVHHPPASSPGGRASSASCDTPVLPPAPPGRDWEPGPI